MCCRTVLSLLLSAAVYNLTSGSDIGTGKLTAISVGENGAAYCTSIPYPAAPQIAVLLEGQSITCESCDPSGKRDTEIAGFHLLLTDTAVLVYHAEDCNLHVALPLDRSCAPRSFFISSREHRVYVLCHSTPKYMSVNYRPDSADFSISELLPRESDGSAPVNGTFISGDSGFGNKDDFFLWVVNSLLHVYEAYGRRLLWPEPISAEDFDIDCDTLTEVYALSEHMSGNPRFLLSCTRNGARKLYEFVLHSGDNPRELQSFTGSPKGSPDGEFLVVVSDSRTSFTVYRISDTSQNVPVSFGSIIEQARFDQSGTLTLVVRGEDIKLVNVESFFSSGGTEGEISLPDSATNCPAVSRCLPHGSVQDGHYLVMTSEGSTYEGRVYDLKDGSYTVIGSISGRPEAASFQILTSTATPPTSAPPTSNESAPPTSSESPTVTTPSIGFVEGNPKQSPLSRGEIAAIVIGLLIFIVIVVAVVFHKRISSYVRNTRCFCFAVQKPIPQSTEAGARPPPTGDSVPVTPIPSRGGTPPPIQVTDTDDVSVASTNPLFSRSSGASLPSSHTPVATRGTSGEGLMAPLLPGSGASSTASSRQPTPVPPHRADVQTTPDSRAAGDRRSESPPAEGHEDGTPPSTVAAATAISNEPMTYPRPHARNLLASDGRSKLEPSRDLLLTHTQLGTN